MSMENGGDREAKRRRILDEKLRNMRGELHKDLEDIEAQLNDQQNGWIEAFRVLEAMNKNDQTAKEQFHAMYKTNKDKLEEIKAGILGAMDAVEVDVRRCHDDLEDRIGEGDETSDDAIVMDLSINLGQYYQLPNLN